MDKTQIFIEKAKKIHGNKYDYSLVKYEKNTIKVPILCIIHGQFFQTPNRHLLGQKCTQCVVHKLKYDTITFIEKAKQVHNNKYNYSQTIFEGTDKKIIVICNIHGQFLQKAGDHLYGKRCKSCTYDIREANAKETKSKFKYNTESFIAKAKEIHRGKYIYDKVIYEDYNKPVIIICPDHGEFEQQVKVHLHGKSGCFKCGCESRGPKTSLKTRHDLPTFIKKARDVHGEKYNYDKVIYINSHTSVIIICPNHGEFKNLPIKHTTGTGCQKCQACPSCLLWKTNGRLCVYCKPKDINPLYQKTKEMEVVRFLRNSLPDTPFIHNKSVTTAFTGSHLFPDILFDCAWYNLIVEIDENQHRGASYECDKQRMYDIIAKTGLPCVFIRYNPDNKCSDKNILLNKVNEYLNLTEQIWDDYGFKAEYLFYTKIIP